MAIKAITDKQFDSLIESIDGYFCTGWSRNAHAESGDEWDTLGFKYDGCSSLGLEFSAAHPFSHGLDRINYDMIEIRFSAKYPYTQEWGVRITDPTQVKRLTAAFAEPYRQYREFGTLGQRASRVAHKDGEYISA